MSRMGGIIVLSCRRPIIDRPVASDSTRVMESTNVSFGLFSEDRILDVLRRFMLEVDIFASIIPVNPLKNLENSLARERR